VGGVLGALALKPLVARFGRRRVLLASGVGRALWTGVFAIACWSISSRSSQPLGGGLTAVFSVRVALGGGGAQRRAPALAKPRAGGGGRQRGGRPAPSTG
jgi:hypothetical protein